MRVCLWLSILVLQILLLPACTEYQSYTPSPIDIEKNTRDYGSEDINSPEIRNWLEQSGQDVKNWPKAQWDIESLALVGQYFSTDLAVARAKVNVAEAGEITAGQKPNPDIDLSLEHHSDQPGDVSPWTFGSIFNWVYERPEKRQTRIDYAKAKTEVARLKQLEIKWQIRDQIMNHYLDTVEAIQKKKMVQAEKETLQQELDLLERSLELGQISDFEISTVRLQLQRLILQLSKIDAEKIRARTSLALATGLPANGLDKVELDNSIFSSLPELNTDDLKLDLLQVRALVERPDMLRVLSEYVVTEADLHHEIENQYPDITLSPGFIFDQDDKIWALATSWMLPLNARNEGLIAEAEARRELKAQELIAFQGQVLGQVHKARIRYRSAVNTFHETDSLITDLEDREVKLQKQYNYGYTDRLTILRNQLETLSTKRSRFLFEMDAWRAFFSLENAVMSPLN